MTEDSVATFYAALRTTHFAFGGIGLIAFWIQIAKRKGGSNHRRLGWFYLAAMTGVLLTALPMTVFTWLFGQPEIALFLGFLTLITSTAGLQAVMASRNRSSDAWVRGTLMKTISALVLCYSLLLFGLYFRMPTILLPIMGALGVFATIEYVIRLRSERPYHWVVDHINGILGTGIAVHIAFLAFGLRRLVGGNFTLWAFIVPIAIGHFMSLYFRRSLRAGSTPATGKDPLSETAQ